MKTNKAWVVLCGVVAIMGFWVEAKGWSPPEGADNNALIRPNDMLDIRVYDEAEMNTVVRVADDGTIAFPLIGKVDVAGVGVQEAGRKIQQRLEQGYLQRAQVNVVIVEYSRRLFTILGQVQRAGTYRFPDREKLNLLQAIGIAGGYAPAANMARVSIKRQIHGKEVVLRFNAKKMARDEKFPAVEVMPGDMITVEERLF